MFLSRLKQSYTPLNFISLYLSVSLPSGKREIPFLDTDTEDRSRPEPYFNLRYLQTTYFLYTWSYSYSIL